MNKKLIYGALAVFAFGMAAYANISHATPNGTPVLMYHEIVTDSVATPPGDTVVTLTKFNQQMAWLKRNGYCSMQVSQLINYMTNTGRVTIANQAESFMVRPSKCKPVVLTFDDGWNNQQNALPGLRNNGFTATFFIIGTYPDSNNSSYMNWNKVNALLKYGHEIGSHTMTHPYNMLLSDATYEVATSKTYIASKTGQQIVSLAWPGGYYTADLLNFAETVAKYKGTLSVDDNWCYSSNISLEGTPYCDWHTGNYVGDDEFKIKRIFVDGRCSIAEFGTIVNQGHTMACVGDGTKNMEAPGIMRVPVDPFSTYNVPLARDVVEPSNTGEEYLWRTR